MDVPIVEPFTPTDNFLLEYVEKSRIQMSALYFEPNVSGHYCLSRPAPAEELSEVLAFYRRALGREVEGMGNSGCSIEAFATGPSHDWIFSTGFGTGGHLSAGAATMTKDINGVWGLEWIYIHPFERRRGLLGDIKLIFDRMYGNYVFCGPFSASGRRACVKLAGGDEGRLYKDYPI